MKTLVEGDLIIINSRYNRFWFELVLVVNEVLVASHGQYRSYEQAEKVRNEMLNSKKLANGNT